MGLFHPFAKNVHPHTLFANNQRNTTYSAFSTLRIDHRWRPSRSTNRNHTYCVGKVSTVMTQTRCPIRQGVFTIRPSCRVVSWCSIYRTKLDHHIEAML